MIRLGNHIRLLNGAKVVYVHIIEQRHVISNNVAF